MNINPANIVLVVAFIVLLFLASLYVYNFIRLSKEQQIENIKEWLKYAVTIAEKELGGGTGQLKLRYVYNMFIEKFPKLDKIISFKLFSLLVDEALIWMRNQVETNSNITEYIK